MTLSDAYEVYGYMNSQTQQEVTPDSLANTMNRSTGNIMYIHGHKHYHA
jgi:hypothetical protein